MRRTRSLCCARAVSGHAAAPLIIVMNSRRLTHCPPSEGYTLSHLQMRVVLCSTAKSLQLVRITLRITDINTLIRAGRLSRDQYQDPEALSAAVLLLDDLVGGHLHDQRHREAECLRRFILGGLGNLLSGQGGGKINDVTNDPMRIGALY
jgi:hypothetical protein